MSVKNEIDEKKMVEMKKKGIFVLNTKASINKICAVRLSLGIIPRINPNPKE